MRYVKLITRQMMQAEPDTLWVFGDNMARAGYGGQAKEMRGEPNAVGIPTKMLPDHIPEAFFKDTDFERAKVKIDDAFIQLFCHAIRGGDIVWPKDGIGTGLAELPSRSPKIWGYIEMLKGYLAKVSK